MAFGSYLIPFTEIWCKGNIKFQYVQISVTYLQILIHKQLRTFNLYATIKSSSILLRLAPL